MYKVQSFPLICRVVKALSRRKLKYSSKLKVPQNSTKVEYLNKCPLVTFTTDYILSVFLSSHFLYNPVSHTVSLLFPNYKKKLFSFVNTYLFK